MESAFVTSIFDDYNKLEGKQSFLDFFEAFKQDPKLEDYPYPRLGKYKNVYAVGINNQESVIIGYFPRYELYLLLKTGKDQEVYSWMNEHLCSVEYSKNMVYISTTSINNQDLFGNASNLQLLEIGVPLEILHLIRNIHTLEELEAYENELNANTYLALIMLANHAAPVEEIVKLYQNEHLFKNNKNYFNSTPLNMIFIEENTDFELLYAKPSEKWSVTLQDEQNRLINKDYIGPARLLGVAGSGKTIIALKRAKRFASQAEENERILITTFTKNLISDMENTLHSICNDKELEHIMIQNSDGLFHDLFETLIHDVRVDYTHQLWNEVYAAFPEFPFELHTVIAEWEKVVEANEAYSLEKWVVAPHTSRPDRFSLEEKQKLWEIFAVYLDTMNEKKIYDKEYSYYKLNDYLFDTYHGEYFYKHMIIDEAQDLSLSELRLLRTLAGNQHQNDLYLVGDEKQRIYLKKAVLEKAGIEVGKRIEYLTTSYRTTNAILQYALKIVEGIDEILPSVSLNLGKVPEIHEYESFEEEAEYIYSKIIELNDSGVQLREICIVLEQNKQQKSYIDYLEERGIDTYTLSSDDLAFNNYEAVRITTIHRVKGLEFDYIFLAGTNQGIIPGNSYDYLDPMYQYLVNQQKCLLYVALTRARKEVYITCSSELSCFIPILE